MRYSISFYLLIERLSIKTTGAFLYGIIFKIFEKQSEEGGHLKHTVFIQCGAIARYGQMGTKISQKVDPNLNGNYLHVRIRIRN